MPAPGASAPPRGIRHPRGRPTGVSGLRLAINTAFIERVNLSMRQHVAAVARRVSTLCQGEDGLRQQLAVFQTYLNFCLPHARLRQLLPQPVLTKGSGSAKQ